MWRSGKAGLSNDWTALLCALQEVTCLLYQTFPLCSQASIRMKQGEYWRRPFPQSPSQWCSSCLWPQQPILLAGTSVWSSLFFPLICLWTAATPYVSSPASRVYLSFLSSAVDACFEAVVFACLFPELLGLFPEIPSFSQLTFLLLFLLQIPPWEPVLL